MTTYKIDQGTNFGTWEDTTSRLLYDDAMPAMLNGINTSGNVLSRTRLFCWRWIRHQ